MASASPGAPTSQDEIGCMQRMQTCELDLQIGFTVAVHVTLHDGPVVNGVKFETQLASVVVELLRSDELERLLARPLGVGVER